ncbi:nitrate reductase molybdenum cofactor assembly chaperone [Herbaspirillum sp. AP02]|uniref:nitrate reductase molybdenum cofactor assembly chaperone n=1 Tax=unclassified Herbaspirillum TaxID=2624150 RepID=UPI0015D974EF|nr:MULTISPECIES: nitrate reductase molybdenum cofactor assembly chaperone [unclassified Herbaspirillum]MBG7621024.1 nitrate reductase molybdenum cofactor assembly chaperone [Herbaspirillum sp. AP02]NZD68753.1 nitrate reductase molybdenum cofactor assembly chaperone [Herbaspirillum sp. AP21]
MTSHVNHQAGSGAIYRIVSALMSYPQPELIAALPEIEQVLQAGPAVPDALQALQPLLHYLKSTPLIALQEHYVDTFDRSAALSLHLFEHIHGESRDRGQAMVDLLEEYRSQGLEPATSELPDYVPLFLEFLSLLSQEKAAPLLGEAIHVVAAIGQRLQGRESPYALPLLLLTRLTDVVPREQDDPPVRDMDEAMEVFGPGADGVEPLLKPALAGVQPLHFHPRQHARHTAQPATQSAHGRPS